MMFCSAITIINRRQSDTVNQKSSMTTQTLKLRHFLWLSFGALQCYSLYKDESGLSFRRITMSRVPSRPSDETLADDDARTVRMRALLNAVGVDMSKVTKLDVVATDLANVASVHATDGAARAQVRVTVSRPLLQPSSDDVSFEDQLRNAARTGDVALNTAQSNAVLAPAFERYAANHQIVGQMQLSLLLVLLPVCALLLRRRFPSAHEHSLLIANVAYLGGLLTVEQSWLPRVRAHACMSKLGPSYVNAALEAAEIERAANRQRHAQLVAAVRSTDWNERVTARFMSIFFSRSGNYLGDFGFSTTTQIEWLAERKAKLDNEQQPPPT
jgi:hypothetical protein